MSIPTTPLMWVLAFLPIAVLLVLLIKFQWGVAEAAPIGLVITIVIGLTFYKADIMLIAAESVKGIWNALVILVIVWTAVLMYQVGDEANAFQAIRSGMRKLLPNELLLVIAMGWVFESFLQGITGFGVPVAVGAPLLMGIGVSPLWAVIIPLLGQSWGNTFGTLAAAWDSLAMSSGLAVGSGDYWQAALWAASFLLLWNAILGMTICWFYGKGKAVKKGLPAVALTSAIQGGGELVLSQINTTLACFVPACLSLIVLLLMGRTKMYREAWSVEDSPIMDRAVSENGAEDGSHGMNLIQAFVPYLLLSVITLTVLLVGPVKSLLGRFSFGLAFPETQTGYGFVNAATASFSPFSPFTHASMFLLVSSLIGLAYYKRHGWIKAGGVRRIFVRSVSMTMPSGIAVIGLVIMSRIMSGTGQTVVLANGIASVLGSVYVAFAPFVGLLGTFMTGSNMSSNILFGDFQLTTANLLGANTPAVLGSQTAGGSIGSTISPSNIVLGTTTANIPGNEGRVLKKIIVVAVPATLLIGVILFVLVCL